MGIDTHWRYAARMTECLFHSHHPVCPECGSTSIGTFAQGFGGYPPGGGFGGGGGPGLRCQMGHDIAPGASYCAQGHPVALDAMQFDPHQHQQQPQHQQHFGPPPGQFAPPPGPPGFPGYPPPQQQPYPGFDPNAQFAPPPPQPYGQQGGPGYAPPQQHGAPPMGGGYAPPQAQQPYAPPPPQGAPQPAYEPPPAQPANLPPNALRGFLVAYQSNAGGEFWPLTGGRHTIGRANSGEQLDIPLADATISSKHAAITVDVPTNTVTVEDRGSTNGTYVNDEHIGYSGRRDLRDGDRVRFGGFSTIVKIVSR